MDNFNGRLRAFVRKPALLFAFLLAMAPASHAASFDCNKASPPVETAICGNQTVSQLDSDLAVAWKNALAQSSDPAALKTAQRRWLTARNTCGADTSCLEDRYRERLAALSGSPLAADRWEQSWERDTNLPGVGGNLTFTGSPPTLHFSISGVNGADASGYEGDVSVNGEQAHYRGKDGCRLDFVKKGARIQVHETNGPPQGCGQASGVDLGGVYVTSTKTAAKPAKAEAGLLTLKVLDSGQQDKAARSLLGKDYDTVVATINMSDPGQDIDHLGAKVERFFVRGIADTNASIVMHRGTQLWIGVLVFDSSNHVRMRYYTNVPEWKSRLPETLRSWHDSIDKNLPIDMMS